MIKAWAIAAAMLLASLSAVWSEDAYPTHPIRFIVPFAAGGGTDAQCRVLVDALKEMLA